MRNDRVLDPAPRREVDQRCLTGGAGNTAAGRGDASSCARNSHLSISLMTKVQCSKVHDAHVGCGSWLCENAETGSLTGLCCSAMALREVCKHIFPISSLTQPDAVSHTVSARGLARNAKVRAHHALTAARTGLTPKIFST